MWVGTKEFISFFFLPNSMPSAKRRSFGEVRRKDSKHTMLDEPVVLFLRAKPHGSQNVTKSGCNKNQDNLNHKQMDILPKAWCLPGQT